MHFNEFSVRCTTNKNMTKYSIYNRKKIYLVKLKNDHLCEFNFKSVINKQTENVTTEKSNRMFILSSSTTAALTYFT